MTNQPTEDLRELRDKLREEIREARGTLKDLRHEIREARQLIASAEGLATTLAEDKVMNALEAAVTEQLAALGETTKAQMEKSVVKVISEFDKIRDVLLGKERVADDREQRSIPELLQDPAILSAAQHKARANREAGRG